VVQVRSTQRLEQAWVAVLGEGKTTGHWSEPAITRIAQGLPLG
jgi:hypothetical protein